MMWFSGASLVTLLSLGALLPAAAQTPLSAALKEIRETAADICATVEQKGQKSNLQLSGEVQAKVAGVSAKLADLGVKSSGEISSQEYQGVSQEVLATALSDIRTCRQHVFDKLLDKMIVSAYASVPPPSTSQSASRVVLPSRLFAGPHQYPPQQFAAYGIVAFKSHATPGDKARYQAICNGYVATLLFYRDVKAALKEQMVTVWPTESDGEADNLNKMYRDSLCSDAVNHYGLGQALEDINKATRQGYKFEGQGPFLLAWSPSESMNKPDALVLVLDLSNVTTSEEAKRMFDLWSRRIQQNSDLWLPGFNKLALKDEIRQWADKFGSKALSLIGIKE